MGLLIGFTTILVVIAAGSGARPHRRPGRPVAAHARRDRLLRRLPGTDGRHDQPGRLSAAPRPTWSPRPARSAACFAAYAADRPAALEARHRRAADRRRCPSSYVNAGNLGLAIAAYVVGDITVVVPTLLVQMLLVQPARLIVLDRLTGRGTGVARGAAAAGHRTR